MSYKEITTEEEVLKRYKTSFTLQQMKDSLSYLPSEISEGMMALAFLQMAAYVVNNDDPAVELWLPDFNDSDQEKWYPWYYGGDSSGSGWSFFGSCGGWSVTAAVGRARLALKDEGRSDHMHEFFEQWYKKLWLISKP